MIDNNQKVTDFVSYYQLSKLYQNEAKTLTFYKPCELFDIILLLRRNRRKFVQKYIRADPNASHKNFDFPPLSIKGLVTRFVEKEDFRKKKRLSRKVRSRHQSTHPLSIKGLVT